VERLRAMKMNHEEGQAPQQPELPDELARQLLAHVNVGSITDGSVIFSINQTGGQTAHQITNVGYQRKQIPVDLIPEFLNLMRAVGPFETVITASILDSETDFLARQLTELLTEAGWTVHGDSLSGYGTEVPKAIVFIVPQAIYGTRRLPLDTLAHFLKRCGFKIQLALTDIDDRLPTILVNGFS